MMWLLNFRGNKVYDEENHWDQIWTLGKLITEIIMYLSDQIQICFLIDWSLHLNKQFTNQSMEKKSNKEWIVVSFMCCKLVLVFQFVHRPYPMVEALMFPASGVGLEADGCWQRKGFGKQRVSNRWKGAYASKSPPPANSPVTNCGKILSSSRLGMDRRSWWSLKCP